MQQTKRKEENNTLLMARVFVGPSVLLCLLFTALALFAIPTEQRLWLAYGWLFLFTGGIAAGIGLGTRWLWIKISITDIQGRTIHASKSALVQKDGTVTTLPSGPAGYGANKLTSLTEHRHAERPFDTPALNPAIVDDTTPKLPPVTHFDSLVVDWKPNVKEILLALGPGGQRLTVEAQDLCHVAIAGITGGGKSVLMRLVIAQLLFAGAHVVLADPHYTPYDAESGEDWRPIEKRLYLAPAVSAREIAFVLDETVKEMDNRLAKRRAGISWGLPFFLAIDELPVIAADLPDIAPQAIARIVREGRKVGVLLITSAQDWLVKTIGADSGAVRNNFRTAFYVGGDQTTGRVLLDLPKGREGSALLESAPLGKGVALLRSKATPKAELVRVPFVTNESLYALLGTPQTAQEPPKDNSVGFTRPGAGIDEKPQPKQPSEPVINAYYRQIPERTASREPKTGTRLYDVLQAYRAGFNSVRKIADNTGYSIGSVHTMVEELRNRGLIPPKKARD